MNMPLNTCTFNCGSLAHITNRANIDRYRFGNPCFYKHDKSNDQIFLDKRNTSPIYSNSTLHTRSDEALSWAQKIPQSPIRIRNIIKVRRYNSGRWSKVECEKFIYYLRDSKFKNWSVLSKQMGTRSSIQVKSHAQKVFQRWMRGEYTYETLFDVYEKRVNLSELQRFRECERDLATAYILYKFRK